MPMNPLDVKAAMATGLGLACATCAKFWRPKDAGVTDGHCAATGDCAGPISGKDFPEYEGPITNFTAQCFVCGGQPKYAIRVAGSLRVFGACEPHMQMVQKFRAEAGRPVPVQLRVPKKKSLFETMAETEAQWAADDAAKREE